MHNVKPYQVRKQSDGVLHPVAITERLLAVSDSQYVSPVLLLREQPYSVAGSPTVTVTRVTSSASVTLAEVTPVAPVPLNSFVVSYNEGIIYLNLTEIAASKDTSAALYIVEYQGLGTLVSTRDILGRDADPSSVGDSDDALQRFDVTSDYALDGTTYTTTATTSSGAAASQFSFVLSGTYVILTNTDVMFYTADHSTKTLAAATITHDTLPDVSASAAQLCIISDYAAAIYDGVDGIHLYELSGTPSGTSQRMTVTSLYLGFTPSKAALLSPGKDTLTLTYIKDDTSIGYVRLTTDMFLFDQVNIDITTHIDVGMTDILGVSAIQGPNTTFTVLQGTGGSTVSVTSLYYNTYVYAAGAVEVISRTTLPYAGALTSFAIGYGPDGSISTATYAPAATELYITSIRADGELILAEVSLPNTGEIVTGSTLVHGSYILLTEFDNGPGVSLTSRIYDLANYTMSAPVTVDMSINTGPGTVAAIDAFPFDYGGFYQILYFDAATGSNSIYILDYAKLGTSSTTVGTDGLLDWEANTTTDTTYVSDATPGTQLTLLTTCKDMELAAGKAGTLDAVVTAKQDTTGDSASFRVVATLYNDGATTSIVGTPSVTVIAADPEAATWLARAYSLGNYAVIYGHVDGSTNNVAWHAKGKFVKVEAALTHVPENLNTWEGTTTTDETYTVDTTIGTELTIAPATSTEDIILSGEMVLVDAVVTAYSVAGVVASFRIAGTLEYDGSTTTVIGSPITTILAADTGAATWVARVYSNGAKAIISCHADGSSDNVTWVARGTITHV